MKLEGMGMEITLPENWEARIFQLETLEAAEHGGIDLPVLHAANFALPEERGDYGSGAVELMTNDNVFIALLEFEPALAATALYAPVGMPRELDPDDFRTNGMQRWIPGQSAYQAFFNEGGRAFCLYIVLGSYLRRPALAAEAERILRRIRLTDSQPPGIA